eukprot:1198557-Rhodomonas_salina.1
MGAAAAENGGSAPTWALKDLKFFFIFWSNSLKSLKPAGHNAKAKVSSVVQTLRYKVTTVVQPLRYKVSTSTPHHTGRQRIHHCEVNSQQPSLVQAGLFHSISGSVLSFYFGG